VQEGGHLDPDARRLVRLTCFVRPCQTRGPAATRPFIDERNKKNCTIPTAYERIRVEWLFFFREDKRAVRVVRLFDIYICVCVFGSV